MAYLETAADIKANILDRADENTDGTSDYESQALDYINRAYMEMYAGGGAFETDLNIDWPWAVATGWLTILPSATDTVALTEGLASGHITLATYTDVAGYIMLIPDVPEVLYLTSVQASTNIDSENVFTGTSATHSCRIAKIDYALSTSFVRMAAPVMAYNGGGKVTFISAAEMNEKYPPHNMKKGQPSRMAQVGKQTVRVNSFATQYYNLKYEYITLPPAWLTTATTSLPEVPRQYRTVLADMALYYLLADKEDARLELIGEQAKAGLRRMKRERQNALAKSARMGHIAPRSEGVNYVSGLKVDSSLY